MIYLPTWMLDFYGIHVCKSYQVPLIRPGGTSYECRCAKPRWGFSEQKSVHLQNGQKTPLRGPKHTELGVEWGNRMRFLYSQHRIHHVMESLKRKGIIPVPLKPLTGWMIWIKQYASRLINISVIKLGHLVGSFTSISLVFHLGIFWNKIHMKEKSNSKPKWVQDWYTSRSFFTSMI